MNFIYKRASKQKRMKKNTVIIENLPSSNVAVKKSHFLTAIGNTTNFSLWLKRVSKLYLTDEVSETV